MISFNPSQPAPRFGANRKDATEQRLSQLEQEVFGRPSSAPAGSNNGSAVSVSKSPHRKEGKVDPVDVLSKYP